MSEQKKEKITTKVKDDGPKSEPSQGPTDAKDDKPKGKVKR